MNKQQFKTYGIALGIIVLLFIGLGIINASGYRLTFKGIVKAATLEIIVERAGSKVFVDNDRERVTEQDNETVTLRNVSPGVHEILVSKDGFWPWMKTINVGRDTNFKIGSFTLRSDVEGVIIPKEDPEYGILTKEFEAVESPTKTSPVESADGTTKAWIEGTSIFVQKSDTSESSEVFSGSDTITNLEFYKDRSDVLIFSASNGIFAIEAEKRGTQNFQPLYKGVTIGPRFFIDRSENLLYAKDGDLLLIINL